MKLFFTNHAKDRMRERKITKNGVEKAVFNPDRTYPGPANKKRVQKRFGNKRLEVVFGKEGNKIVIITAYWV